MPSGLLWTSCTARPPTTRPTRTSSLYGWTAWVDPETSSRTTCWNCWERSSTLSLRRPTSQSANELVIDVIDSSLKWLAYWVTDSCKSINWKNLTIVPKRQPLDTAVITFMVHTALISSAVQRKKMSMKHLGCCSLFRCRCRDQEPSDRSATLGDTRWQGFSFHVQALTCTVCKC